MHEGQKTTENVHYMKKMCSQQKDQFMHMALQDGGHLVPCHTRIHHIGIPRSTPWKWTMRAPRIEYDTIARIHNVTHYTTPSIQHAAFSCRPDSMDEPPRETPPPPPQGPQHTTPH